MGKIKGMMMAMRDTPEYEEGFEAYCSPGDDVNRGVNRGRNPYGADAPHARQCWALGWQDACLQESEARLRIEGPN